MSEKGFTLIDMCIALIVAGLLAAGALFQYNNYMAHHARDVTGTHDQIIETALAEYYFTNSSYPCPANPALPETDVNYGAEDCAGTVAAGGVMLIGAVPVQALKIPRHTALDGWSHKFTYAVTRALAAGVAPPFDPNGGALTVRTWSKAESVSGSGNEDVIVEDAPPGADIHWILISHGPRGIGARTATGQVSTACPTGAALTREAENCDGDATFADMSDGNAVSSGNNADYFDDMTWFDDGAPTRIWANSTINPQDIFSNVGLIGINNNDPQTSLDVVGNIRAENGAGADQFCDTNGANCFPSELIGGNVSDCGAGAITGIRNGRVVCQSNYAGIVSGNCSGAGMAGISVTGGIICN